MKRSEILLALASAAVLVLCASGCSRPAPDASSPASASAASAVDPTTLLRADGGKPPNILLITVDTLRADHLSAWGYVRATSPNIDRLAGEGLRFDQAQSQWPKTGPSFASIFTSTYPKDNGIVRQVGVPLPCTFTTLAEVLQRAGYSTHAVVANGAVGQQLYFDQGFGTFLESWKLPNSAVETDSVAAENVTRLAIAAAGKINTSKPWFLWVHYLDPHAPYRPPAAFSDRFQGDAHFDPTVQVPVTRHYKQELAGIGKRQMLAGDTRLAFYVARYDAEISYVDEQIGRLLAALREKKLLSGTLTAFTADHGESLGEHDYYFNHGRLGYQTCLHVPLILHWPGHIAKGVDREPVALLHLAPTLLAAAGISLPEGRWAQGQSLWPRIANPAAASDTISFSESGTSAGRTWIRIARDRRFSLLFTPNPPEQRWIGGVGQPWALFDLENDPGENENVVARFPGDADRLKRAMGKWWRAPGFDCTSDENTCNDSRQLDSETTELLKSLGYL
ncbi:MAG: sulfatase [Thermoanaerobaculia bacterium]